MHTQDHENHDDPTISGRPDFLDGFDLEDTVDADNATDIQQIVHAQIQGNVLKHHSLLTFDIGGIQLFSTLDEEIVFGRNPDKQQPDPQIIDLSGFNAHEAGVSRQHAALQRDEFNQIVLIDLESSNGTYINDERLIPMHAYSVADGDEIRLGYLKIIIQFDSV